MGLTEPPDLRTFLILTHQQDSGNWANPPRHSDEALARVQQSYAICISHGSDMWNFPEQLEVAMKIPGMSSNMKELLGIYKIKGSEILDPVGI